MPRIARASVGGVGYHVINRRRVFFEDGDSVAVLKAIGHACVEIPMDVFGYGLFPKFLPSGGKGAGGRGAELSDAWAAKRPCVSLSQALSAQRASVAGTIQVGSDLGRRASAESVAVRQAQLGTGETGSAGGTLGLVKGFLLEGRAQSRATQLEVEFAGSLRRGLVGAGRRRPDGRGVGGGPHERRARRAVGEAALAAIDRQAFAAGIDPTRSRSAAEADRTAREEKDGIEKMHVPFMPPIHPIKLKNQTIAIAEVRLADGSHRVYGAANTSARLTPEQIARMRELGIEVVPLRGTNHAEINIIEHLPPGARVERWGISRGRNQTNIPCPECAGPVANIGGVVELVTYEQF